MELKAKRREEIKTRQNRIKKQKLRKAIKKRNATSYKAQK
jgi:hypothetical protein